jgi:hypothetical protein
MTGFVNGILSYVKNMFHTVKKEDVIKTTEFVFNNLTNDVITAIEDVIANSDSSLIENSGILKNLNMFSELKAKNNKDLLIKIKDIFTDIEKSYKDMLAVIENNLSDVITNTASTPKDAAILKVVSDIGSMNIFIMDLLYSVIMDKENSMLPSIKLKSVEANTPEFIKCIKYYGKNFSKVVKDLPKVSSTVININDGKESMLSGLLSHAGVLLTLPHTQGFTNNPIYHIRMWMIDREIVKYESLKDRKKMIELRLLELKLDEQGESDTKLQKQIQYYEEKLNKLEYEIAKLEK